MDHFPFGWYSTLQSEIVVSTGSQTKHEEIAPHHCRTCYAANVV